MWGRHGDFFTGVVLVVSGLTFEALGRGEVFVIFAMHIKCVWFRV